MAEYDDVIRGSLFNLVSGPPTLTPPLTLALHYNAVLLLVFDTYGVRSPFNLENIRANRKTSSWKKIIAIHLLLKTLYGVIKHDSVVGKCRAYSEVGTFGAF